MEKSVEGVLQEYRCAALSDYFLGVVAPAKDEGVAEDEKLNLVSLDDLYHYLLMDVQVSSLVESARVAEKIAAMQVLIGAIYSGLEPGYEQDFSKDELEAWHKRFCNFADWAGYETLKYHPQNYITPALRLNKSKSFKELETNLAQTSLSEKAVQTALYEHLKKFCEICDLELISGYIDGTETDSDQFKKADYYFIGRQRTPPYSYFWRKATVELNAESKYLNPASWTEWMLIDIPSGHPVLAFRPVFFAGRLMVVLVEGYQDPDLTYENGTIAQGQWHLEMKLAQLAVNGRWSMPVSLGKKDFSVVPKDSSRLVALTCCGTEKHVDDVLVVCFTTTEVSSGAPMKSAVAEEGEQGWMFASLNALFEPQEPNKASLKVLINGRFANPMGLQHKLPASELAVLDQTLVPASKAAIADATRDGLLSRFLSTNISFSSQTSTVNGVLTTSNVMRVQGVCDVDRPEYDLEKLVFFTKTDISSYLTYFELSKVGAKGIKLSCHHQSSAGFSFSLRMENEDVGAPDILVSISPSDFIKSDFGVQVVRDITLTNEQLERLWSLGPISIRKGANFYIAHGSNGSQEEYFINAINQLSVHKKPENVVLSLRIVDEIDEEVVWSGSIKLTGWTQTPWIHYSWTGEAAGKKLKIIWGEPADGVYGRNLYAITIKQLSNIGNAPLISKQASGAQFLDLRSMELPLKWVRLNSTFGPWLVAKAAISVDEVLSRKTQFIEEPRPWESPDTTPDPGAEPIDFNSAHGMFYWDLFFHLPFMIAHRLCEERKYLESQNWYHYIFNPHLRQNSPGALAESDRFWLCRPLLEEGDLGYVAQNLVDPDALAFADRIHYRKTIFIAYVRCIIAHADSLYRHLTRDSLTAAKQQYVRALSLMGNDPDAKIMSNWVPKSVGKILDRRESVGLLGRFSQTQDVNVANLPARIHGEPDFSLILLDVFRPVANDHVLDIWKYLENCLHNMRHNLTIDGKPMSLLLYEGPTDPVTLLRAQAGGSSGASRSAGGWRNIPHYRFRVMLAAAQSAVQTLIAFGREVRQCMEQRDRGTLEELQQKQMIELGAYVKAVQEEALLQQEVSLKALQESKKVTDGRIDHYTKLLEQAIAPWESQALEGQANARLSMGSANPFFVAGGAANSAPNLSIVGAAVGVGGINFGSPIQATGIGLQGASEGDLINSDKLSTSSHYRRREEEWRLALGQAEAEMQVVVEQEKSQQHALYAAQASLAQAEKANAHAQEIFSFYKTRSSNVELYRWLLSQISVLYFQAYDAVAGLCLSAETSWQYEMGDFDTHIIRPNVWMDNFHGLCAGESMSFDLMILEKEFLNRNERRLELIKTLSLRQLFEGGKFVDKKTWDSVLQDLINTGKLDFELSQQLFDHDYPGQYCRQIVSVSVTLPAVVGPYQDVCATLTQTSSTTLLKPDTESLDYQYGDKSGIPPRYILLNPRNQQQTSINHALDDAGMHQLMFGDERYLPFEGTGLLSHWQLHFPLHGSSQQVSLIQSLTDVIIHIRYLAKAGGTAYTNEVLDRMNS